MRSLTKLILSIALLAFGLAGTATAQNSSINETFKKHFNQTVQDVKKTDDPTKQRLILNESFTSMLNAVQKIEESSNLNKEEQRSLMAFKDEILEKQNELNGWNGFDEIQDDELIDFSDYSQQEMEQANRTLTISLTSALLIVLILLLL